MRTIPVPQPVVQNVFNQHFHGSVGNVAAGSHDFEQHATVNQLEVPNSIDLPSLAQELMRLRQQQVTEATEPEHYEAIGAVQRAEIAANDGDRGKVSTSLAKAGHWTLDVATKIGTTLAAEALKHSMGLK